MSVKRVRRTAIQRKKLRLRKKLIGTDVRPRVSIHRSSIHTSAQAITDSKAATIAQCSTRDKDVKSEIASVSKDGIHSTTTSTKGVLAAKAVGIKLAVKLKEKGVETVIFDRNGLRYHGRVKAVADGLREGGINL